MQTATLALYCFDDDGTVGPVPTGRTTSAVAREPNATIYGYVTIVRDDRGVLSYKATITDPVDGTARSATSRDAVDAVACVLRSIAGVTLGVRAVAAAIAYPFVR
jgi:hypothetical protein